MNMRYLFVLLSLSVASVALFAAEPVTAPAAEKPAAAPPAATTKPTQADSNATLPAPADAAKSAVSDAAGKGPSPQRFVPSEQVRADFDVSFPVDI